MVEESGNLRLQFAEARCKRGHVFFRWFNELPVIALLIIIFLAVLKPF